MQQVSFELYDECKFFCPATGIALIADEPFKPSPATLFVFIDEVGDFEFITPEFLERYSGFTAQEDEIECERFQRFVETLDEPDSVCFSIIQSGMACGPFSTTVHIGIRLNHEPSC